MDRRFEGDVVMVTGASGLIGSACVAAFLEAGARVVAVGGKHGLDEGARNAGISMDAFDTTDLLFVQADLSSDPGSSASLAQQKSGSITSPCS